jgi:hypothetical protein
MIEDSILAELRENLNDRGCRDAINNREPAMEDPQYIAGYARGTRDVRKND